MREGLSKTLLFLIKSNGEISLNEIENLCHDLFYKTATAERMLRKLAENKEIEPIWNQKKTAIVGYKPFEKLEQGELI